MRLVLAAVGRLKAGPERDLVERYLVRARAMVRAAGLTGLDAWDIEEGRGRTAEERRRQESEALRARIDAGAFLVAFDERGEQVPSERFARLVGRERDAGKRALALVVGGPDGLDESVRVGANLVFAFGAATMPHQLVRAVVAEQVYRALTILTGHPYHRE